MHWPLGVCLRGNQRPQVAKDGRRQPDLEISARGPWRGERRRAWIARQQDPSPCQIRRRGRKRWLSWWPY
ncbi:hypothetical protein BCR44DRAFT_1450039 [Catenaria anguillulae PL171]|uniref:Uncharacterized protein n=1 Tax=Catenaria anguillulae PL171 TaxID=765915 RepID=A0A1Y2H6Z9_9FUNG|nr:hypothetical protein BCR44DRAFT_1450039 [Catenaria anguillulae PL171]